jgi:DNA-binding NtrC family response regulator
MPSLSQRIEDIELLAEYFLNKYKTEYNQPDKLLYPDSLQWLKRYSWPGNVRELENLLHREFILADGPSIRLDKVHSIRQERRKSNMDRRQEHYLKKKMKESKAEVVRSFEKEYLTRLLNETDGNVTMAAKRAGKERRSLGKLIKKHGIENTHLNKS